MKFVSINSAKGLTPGKEVYTINEQGEYSAGKLISRTEDAKGLHLKFEIPQYFDEKMPMIKPVYVENITHVAIMKARVEVPETNGVEV